MDDGISASVKADMSLSLSINPSNLEQTVYRIVFKLLTCSATFYLTIDIAVVVDGY
jgi:hypothetical protein